MKAVVLAGGEGTRLHPYTRILPKPLLPIGDRPILEIILDQLRTAGVQDVVLATGHLSSLIETFFGDGSGYGLRITYAREDEERGTVGPLADIGGLDETFILMNGDVLTDPLYGDLLAAHRHAGAMATIATHAEKVELDYGVVELGTRINGTRRIEQLREKPQSTYQVSMGVYIFEPDVLGHVPRDRRMDFPELIELLIERDELVVSYEHRGYWIDVGQVHNLETAVQEYERRAERFVGQAGVQREADVT